MKNIKDYLHLYLGCRFVLLNKDGTEYFDGLLTADTLDLILKGRFGNPKPILRPLSSITEDEEIERDKIWNMYADSTTCIYADAYETKYLLSKHFDLFGLIESGLAIDATTLTP